MLCKAPICSLLKPLSLLLGTQLFGHNGDQILGYQLPNDLSEEKVKGVVKEPRGPGSSIRRDVWRKRGGVVKIYVGQGGLPCPRGLSASMALGKERENWAEGRRHLPTEFPQFLRDLTGEARIGRRNERRDYFGAKMFLSMLDLSSRSLLLGR